MMNYNHLLNEIFYNEGKKCEGHFSVAFDYDQTYKVLKWCLNNNLIILGGDVYVENKFILEPTVDSWYYEPMDSDHDPINSYNKAIEYIDDMKMFDSLYFSVVVK